MIRQRLALPLVLAAALILPACQTTGPLAVRQGRVNYNDAIHDTSQYQLFLNMLRAANYDTTFFLEVTEVDAQLTTGGTLASGVTGLNTIFTSKVGGPAIGINGALQYQEAPTIRYIPLQGQPLVEQVTTPISVDSLAKLFDSDWPLGVVMALATDRIAPRYLDCYAALNAIMELDDHGALVLAPMRSLLTSPPEGGAAYPPSNVLVQNDSLVLYFEPDRLYVYPASEAAHAGNPRTQADSRRLVTRLWLRLLAIYKESMLPEQRAAAEALLANLPPDVAAIEWNTYPLLRRLELRTTPICPAWFTPHKGEPPILALTDPGPVMRTRSAAGIMRAAMYEGSFIQFVDPPTYAQITAEPWNQVRSPLGGAGNFYTLRSSDKHFHVPDAPPATSQPVPKDAPTPGTDAHIDAWLETTPTLNTTAVDMDLSVTPEQMERSLTAERILGHRRRYLLIVQSPTPPLRPTFVCAEYHGTWYYIDAQDEVSRKNFVLLSQIFTMQAIASTNAPLAPSLPIGGK